MLFRLVDEEEINITFQVISRFKCNKLKTAMLLQPAAGALPTPDPMSVINFFKDRFPKALA